jgi:hypothetical protein
MEYLPYLNWNFNEKFEETSNDKLDEQCVPLEQIYLRENKTFVLGQSIEVVQIYAEKISNPKRESLYSYL